MKPGKNGDEGVRTWSALVFNEVADSRAADVAADMTSGIAQEAGASSVQQILVTLSVPGPGDREKGREQS